MRLGPSVIPAVKSEPSRLSVLLASEIVLGLIACVAGEAATTGTPTASIQRRLAIIRSKETRLLSAAPPQSSIRPRRREVREGRREEEFEPRRRRDAEKSKGGRLSSLRLRVSAVQNL